MKQLILAVFLLCFSCKKITDPYQISLIKLKNNNYEEALSYLHEVDSTHENYKQAQQLIVKLDSTLASNKKIAEETKLQTELESAKSLADKISEYSKANREVSSKLIALAEIELYKNWASDILKFETHENEDIKNYSKSAKQQLIKLQTKRLPLLRKGFTQDLNNQLWENDIKVFNTSNNTRINFTGGIFAANKNIKDFETNIQKTLKDLRFKQSIYRWYDGDKEYSYYDLETQKDSDLYLNNF